MVVINRYRTFDILQVATDSFLMNIFELGPFQLQFANLVNFIDIHVCWWCQMWIINCGHLLTLSLILINTHLLVCENVSSCGMWPCALYFVLLFQLRLHNFWAMSQVLVVVYIIMFEQRGPRHIHIVDRPLHIWQEKRWIILSILITYCVKNSHAIWCGTVNWETAYNEWLTVLLGFTNNRSLLLLKVRKVVNQFNTNALFAQMCAHYRHPLCVLFKVLFSCRNMK